MYCRFCGKQIGDDARFCPHCGKEQANASAAGGQNVPPDMNAGGQNVPPYNGMPPYPYGPKEVTPPSPWWAVLGFFLPVVGLILFLVWHDEYPKRAALCGKGALICVIVAAGIAVLCLIGGLIIGIVAFGGFFDTIKETVETVSVYCAS